MRALWGLLRSLAIYYGRPGRLRALRSHYRSFVPDGGLAFDIGAHVGSRVRAFASLGARAVALEPQPSLASFMTRIFARNPKVEVLPSAVGAEVGTTDLFLCESNPTVATTSAEWAAAAPAKAGWERVAFTDRATVPQTTLDALIERFGTPDFAKIDVEGSEDEVLAGLSRPLPSLSFEFLPADRDVALRAAVRLERLAETAGVHYEYNFSLGEQLRLVMRERWWSAEELRAYLAEIPDDGPSGDVYARIRA